MEVDFIELMPICGRGKEIAASFLYKVELRSERPTTNNSTQQPDNQNSFNSPIRPQNHLSILFEYKSFFIDGCAPKKSCMFEYHSKISLPKA